MSKQQITISSVREDLKNGMTRDEIGEKYGLNKTEVKNMFKHPQLKFRKTIKPKEQSFILVDDLTPVTEVVVEASQPIQLTIEGEIERVEAEQAETIAESTENQETVEAQDEAVQETSTWV